METFLYVVSGHDLPLKADKRAGVLNYKQLKIFEVAFFCLLLWIFWWVVVFLIFLLLFCFVFPRREW